MQQETRETTINTLTEKQRTQALRKFYLIQPFLQQEESLEALCLKNNIPLRTARRWVSLYRQYGLAALARKLRKDKEKNRCMTTKLRQFIEGLYLQSPHLSYSAIYRKVKKYQEEKRLPYPKYRTVCYIINKLPLPITTLAHHGSKVYKQQFDLLCRYEANCSNELWQADHDNLDILLINQCGKPQRPWLTIIFDDYSRAIAGYELSFLSPSATKTALGLRMAIWRKKEPSWTICGIPSTLYTDHGSDFTSAHIEQVCIDLKINLIFSQIAQPRGRGKIERFFLTLNQQLLCELPGYTKNKNTRAKLTLIELDALLRKFIIDYNNCKHSQTNWIPKQRWEHNGFLPNLPQSIDHLDLLLLNVRKPRKIMRDGIHFQGLRYLDPILADYIGESVIIRYDPADLTTIRVFYNEKFLCQPICQDLIDQRISLKEIQAARIARKRALHAEIKQRLSLVDAILNTKQRNLVENPTQNISPTISPSKLRRYESDN